MCSLDILCGIYCSIMTIFMIFGISVLSLKTSSIIMTKIKKERKKSFQVGFIFY